MIEIEQVRRAEFSPDAVRDDFIPKEDYLSPEFARLEEERLWPRVWQVACRAEELANVGDFVTYDIANESFIITRTGPEAIKAYFNVCPHRGRQITDGCGKVSEFVCRFHGWRWNLAGENTTVVDREDWHNSLKSSDLHLKEARVDLWGGFVFINMDPGAEPLLKYLSPIPEKCGRFKLEDLRYRWYRTVKLPCNWKAALEFFNEGYHVQHSHPQLLNFSRDRTISGSFGKHSAFWYPPIPEGQSRYGPSPRLGIKADQDARTYFLGYWKELADQLEAIVTPRSYAAAQRLLTEVPENASEAEIFTKLNQFRREAAEAEGVDWPDVDSAYILDAKQDWNIFPNTIFLGHQMIDGLLVYRARPDGADPNSSIFDVWSLVRYAPGAEPALKREFYNDWRECKWGRILPQDFRNVEAVQRGMRSRAYAGSRPNPLQERAVSNLHRVVRQYLAEGKSG
jgi:phenylpropionate dioxygenase-like ring-hydroxylating dioxygenase large terminal subunit